MNKISIACSLIMLSGCATQIDGPSANARLTPTKGNTTTGLVTFKTIGSKVLVTAETLILWGSSNFRLPHKHGLYKLLYGQCFLGSSKLVRLAS